MSFLFYVRGPMKKHGLFLMLLALFSFLASPVIYNSWVFWDDPSYVIENAGIRSLSFSSIWNHFNAEVVQGNYHPLTMLSLSLDYWIGGINPIVFHASNLLLHLLNSFLAYLFVFRLLKNKQLALLVGIAFAIHPLHVESYAWVSERKDVLYVFFFLLGLIQYLRYLKLKSKSALVLCLLFYSASLLSKGMAVVFPLILLMIDFYKERKGLWGLFKEKLLFFLLSFLFGLLALWAQKQGDAISVNQEYPIIQAIFVPLYGLWFYIQKAILPVDLSPLHPYPFLNESETALPTELFLPLIPLGLLVFLLYRFFKKDKLLWFGLGFFLVSVLPVLQFLSVGSAIVSERYTYLAYVGLFLAIFHLLEKAKRGSIKWLRSLVPIFMMMYFFFLAVQTRAQIAVWQNDETLWSDVIDSYPNDFFAYMKRGSYRAKNGQSEKALNDLNRSIALFPYDYYAYNNRGLIYLNQYQYNLAEGDFEKAIQLDSSLYEAFLNLGLIELNRQNYLGATSWMKKAIEKAPNNYLCHLNYALLLDQSGSFSEAFQFYTSAIQLNSSEQKLYAYRGQFLFKQGRFKEALKDFNQGIAITNQEAELYYWKARVYFALGDETRAKENYSRATNLGFRLELPTN